VLKPGPSFWAGLPRFPGDQGGVAIARMSLFRASHSARQGAPSKDLSARPGLQPLRIGAYLHSARDLFRVEGLTGDRALVEDCRNGDLIDLPLSELLSLEPVRLSDDRSAGTQAAFCSENWRRGDQVPGG
jgi:hypothetical protein